MFSQFTPVPNLKLVWGEHFTAFPAPWENWQSLYTFIPWTSVSQMLSVPPVVLKTIWKITSPVFYHVYSEKTSVFRVKHGQTTPCFIINIIFPGKIVRFFFPVEKPTQKAQVAELHPQPPARLHQRRENGLRCLAPGAGSGEAAAEWADQGEAEEISEVSRCDPGLELLSLDWWWLSIYIYIHGLYMIINGLYMIIYDYIWIIYDYIWIIYDYIWYMDYIWLYMIYGLYMIIYDIYDYI